MKGLPLAQEMPLRSLSGKDLGPEGFWGYLNIFSSSGTKIPLLTEPWEWMPNVLSLQEQETELSGIRVSPWATEGMEFQPTIFCLSYAWTIHLLDFCLVRCMSRLNLASRFPRYGWFKGMLMLKTGGMPMVWKRDRRRVIARDHWRSRPGFQAWLHSHCPLGQFPQSLSASFPHQAGDGSPTPPCHQGPLTLYTCTHRSCARIQRENWGTPLPNGREMLPVPSGEVTQGEDAKQTAFIWALLMPQAGAPLWNVPQREWQELCWKNTPASSLFGWNNWGAFYTGSQRSLGEPNPLPSPWTFPVLTPFPPMCHLPTPHSPLFVGIDSQINNLHSRSCLRVHLGGKPT